MTKTKVTWYSLIQGLLTIVLVACTVQLGTVSSPGVRVVPFREAILQVVVGYNSSIPTTATWFTASNNAEHDVRLRGF